MNLLADRKNQLVWDALETGGYKQALNLCNKRIKKGEKGEYLLALKAYTLTLIPTSIEEALPIAQLLSTKNPPLDSIETLQLLSKVWNGLGPKYSEEVTKVWERAVKHRPSEEALAKEWFWGAIRFLDWRGAQKAAMSLQKNFTRKREYWFWAAISSLLLHNSLPDSASDKKLFGMLAYRMISKSRTDTPEDTTVIPARAIQNSQEINFLLELLPYVSSNPTKEALELLNSPNLGVNSKVGAGDWWGLVRKRLDLLEESGEWNEVWKSCSVLLEDVEDTRKKGEGEEGEAAVKGRGDDWKVWEGFVKAAGEIGDTEIRSKTLETISEHRKSATSGSSRNADLALVKFASLFHGKEDAPNGTPRLFEAVKEYFMKTGSKSCCFEDLQHYLERLSEPEQAEYMSFISDSVEALPSEDEKSQISKTAFQINSKKFAYLLNISSTPITTTGPLSPETLPTLNTFITSSLAIYSSSISLGANLLTTDNQHGDDAALLAVMGLIRLYLIISSTSPRSTASQAPLYQAIALLETLLLRSKHNYQALLLLVRLYILLGAIPSALEIYPRLSIKQIQNDTLSHFLLTRISTLYPMDTRVDYLLKEACKIYESSKSQTPSMIKLAFERGGYAQMMGFLEFADRVSGSVCMSMWEIEKRRVGRLRGGTELPSASPKKVLPEGAKVWDNRDFAVVISCERSDKGRFEEGFRVGETPGEAWVRAFMAVEVMLEWLRGSGSRLTDASTPNHLPVIAETLQNILDSEESKKEFTAAEKAYLQFLIQIANVVEAGKTGDTVKSGIETLLESIKRFSVSTKETGVADWQTLHTFYIALDSLNAASLLTSFVKSAKNIKPSIPKQLVADISTAIDDAREHIKKEAISAKSVLEDDDATQELVDLVLDEQGIGKVLREGNIFGIEKVRDGTVRIRESIANAFGALVGK